MEEFCMCGIVGYVGESQAAPILLEGLSKLEYRGYDSAGMAVFDGEKIHVKKTTGRLKVLSELTHDGTMLPGHIGIGHTRWATHGRTIRGQCTSALQYRSDHCGCSQRNYRELPEIKKYAFRKGVSFHFRN